MDTIKLNIGGEVFETCKTTLAKYPNTRLGQLCKSSGEYNVQTDQYFFDRNPSLFNDILDFYRSGTLHLQTGCCGATIRQELAFWEISAEFIGECCLQSYLQYETEMEVITTIKKGFEEIMDYTDEECQKNAFKRYMRKLWLILDQPKSSIAAQIFNYIFLVVVLLSMVSFTLGSHPDFRDEKLSYTGLLFLRQNFNYKFFDDLNLQNPKMVMFGTSLPAKYLRDIDLFCTIFFSVEFLVHFLTCPLKRQFFYHPLNVMDPILLVSMWISYSLERDLEQLVTHYHLVQVYLVTKALVVLRLFRFFRMVKVYSGLRILLLSIRVSLRELFLLLMCVMVAALFFASFIYYAEFNTPDTFPNIFIGIWWSIVTMTTVGYGDVYPKSPYGYIIGCACAFSGVLLVAMPIAVVATNFNEYYQKNKLRDMRIKMIKELRTDKKDKSEVKTSVRKVAPLNLKDLEEFDM